MEGEEWQLVDLEEEEETRGGSITLTELVKSSFGLFLLLPRAALSCRVLEIEDEEEEEAREAALVL